VDDGFFSKSGFHARQHFFPAVAVNELCCTDPLVVVVAAAIARGGGRRKHVTAAKGTNMRHAKVGALVVGCLMLAGVLLERPGMRSAMAAEGEKKPAATFELYKDKSGQFRWRLRMQNSKVIASSGEGYKEKDSAMKAIESVKRVVADAPVKEVEASEAGGGGGGGHEHGGGGSEGK
jgi:uncharacterized protein YegP (UPF0339 family)